jgi:hypothetical protein
MLDEEPVLVPVEGFVASQYSMVHVARCGIRCIRCCWLYGYRQTTHLVRKTDHWGGDQHPVPDATMLRTGSGSPAPFAVTKA